MPDTSHKRRLAAVLFADMVGYTALAHHDERLALELVGELRTLVATSETTHEGKLVKSLGDGFLMTFPSGLAAVHCARSLQAAINLRNTQAEPQRRFQVRVGIHLGDVEERDGDVVGNGVNLAARVMTAAEPGEICLTQPVFDQLDPESRAIVAARGLRELKNLPQPVLLYAIASTPGATVPVRVKPARRRPWVGLSAAAFLVLALGLWLLWRPQLEPRGEMPPRDILLAVLPLKNVYNDAEGAPFIEGLVDSLSSELTRVARYRPGLQIIPSAEVLTHRIATPAEALKFFQVNRVLTGSFQRQGRQVKVVLTLEDPKRRQAINSLSKIRSMDDAFGLQEELAKEALSLLSPGPPAQLPEAPKESHARNPEADFEYMKGLGLMRRFDKESELRAAVAEFESAIRIDPNFALAHAGLAEAAWRLFERTGETDWKERAEAEADRARQVDLPQVHAVLGLIATGTGKPEEAIVQFKRAAEQNPTSPDAQIGLAGAYANSGRDNEAERTYMRAIELSTNYWAGYNSLGNFYYNHVNFRQAERCYLRAAAATPDNYLVACNLGGLYYQMGQPTKARAALLQSIELHPNAEAFSNLGTLDFAERDYTKAGQRFEQAVRLEPNEPTVWGNLGDAWRLAGKSEPEVSAAYARALELIRVRLLINPSDAIRQAQCAYYLACLGKAQEAVEAADRARTISAHDATVDFTTALAYERSGQRAKALEALRAAAATGYPPSEILENPDLAPIRVDPAFEPIQSLIRSLQEKTKPH